MTPRIHLPIRLISIATVAMLAAEARANLIANGDFSNGNTGFTSQYSYNTNNSNPNGPELAEGAYAVVTKPSDVHFAWGSYFDHTSGNSSGKYFVANASSDTSKTVWQSNSISVSQANTPYRFEGWIQMIYPFESNPPSLSFEIGDGTAWTSLGQTLDLSDLDHDDWRPPIVATVGSTGQGVAELWEVVGRHREHITANGILESRRRFRLREELREIVARRLEQKARDICTGQRWDELTDAVVSRSTDPWTAADEMLRPVDA